MIFLTHTGSSDRTSSTRLPLPGHALALQELGLGLRLRRLDQGHLQHSRSEPGGRKDDPCDDRDNKSVEGMCCIPV